MYGIFRKDLRTGITQAFLDPEMEPLWTRVAVKLSDVIDLQRWSQLEIRDKLEEGMVVTDGLYMWCYWDESIHDQDPELFYGQVVVMSNMKPFL